MKVRLAWGLTGAGAASRRGDVTVVIDCLRASSTVVVALASGMRAVIPTISLEPARDPGMVSAGERGGRKLPGFDHGNSPCELRSKEYHGRTLWLSTSNGTPCIHEAAAGAAAVLIGCLLNATAVARGAAAIARAEGRDITLLAAGRNGGYAAEDAFGAHAIARRIGVEVVGEHEGLELVRGTDALEVFEDSASGRRLLDLGYRDDIVLCATEDLHDLTPVYQQRQIVPAPTRGTGRYARLSTLY